MLEIELYVTVRGYGNAEETMLVGDGLSFIMDSPDDDILNGITDIIGYNTLDNNVLRKSKHWNQNYDECNKYSMSQ